MVGLHSRVSFVASTSTQSLHAQIRDRFLGQIREGKLRPGDRLPSESEIMKQFSVSRGTVTRALRDLEVAGVLLRRRGSGTFVCEKEPTSASDENGLHIAMFMPWTTEERTAGSFYIQLHHGISSVCSDRQVLLSLQCLSPVGETGREQLLNAARSLIARRPQVVLYCGLELPRDEMPLNEEVLGMLTKAGMGVVVIDRDVVAYPERSPYTWISFDNRRGSALLVQHLAAEGYRRIAFLGISSESTAVFDRLSGYYDGLRLCRLSADPELVVESDQVPGEDVCDRLLKAKPDAVICKDTGYATKLSFMLTKRGYHLGSKIGLAGFDDDAIASMLPTPLTVVRQPIAPFATAAYQAALSLTRASSDLPSLPRGSHIVVPTELVVRASTRRTKQSQRIEIPVDATS